MSTSAYSASYELTTATAAPAMPSNFSTGTVTDSSVILNWTPGTDPGGAVGGYTVDVSSDEGQTWNVYNPSGGALAGTAAGVAVTGLNASSVYLFEVTATNSAGSSYAAGPIGVKTPALAEGVPTLSVATSTNGYNPWDSAYLSWTYSGDDSPTFQIEYEDTTIGANFSSVNYYYTGNSTTVAGLTMGDSYAFRMRADYADDSVSAWSPVQNFSPPVLTAPSIDAKVANDSSGLQHTVVGWSGAPAGGTVQIEVEGDAYGDAPWWDLGPSWEATDGSTDPLKSAGDQGCAENPGVQGNTQNETGTYTYRLRGIATTGEPTAWTQPATASFGTAPVGVTLTETHTDTTFTVSLTGSSPGGGVITGYYLNAYGTEAGHPGVFDYCNTVQWVGSSDPNSGPITQPVNLQLINRTPGITYHIVVITSPGGTAADSFSKIDLTTNGAVVPTGMPVLSSVVQTANNGQGAIVTWTYSGTDANGFELEQQDTSIGENFHYIDGSPQFVSNQSTGGILTTTYQQQVGLTGGDNYLFRIRADHNDGSVSAYNTSNPLTVQQAAAPTLNVQTVATGNAYGEPIEDLRVGWSGIAAGSGLTLEVKSGAWPGNAWNSVWYGDQGSGAWPAGRQDDDTDVSDEGNALDPGVIGPGTYSYRIRTSDAFGNPTAWSTVQSGTIDGGAGPTPSLNVSGTTITASWPAGSSLLYAADGTGQVIGNGNWPGFVSGTLNAAGTQYTATLQGLQPGTKYDFAAWTPIGSDFFGEPQQYQFGDNAITTGGTAPGAVPAAPAFAHAVYDATIPGGNVKIYWANTPNNEQQYYIYRWVPRLHNMILIAKTDADVTTYVWKPTDDGPYLFRIYSAASGQANWGTYAWTQCQCIGGSDITNHLLGIRAGVNSYSAGTLANLLNVSLKVQQSNWDIINLAGHNVLYRSENVTP